MAIEIKIPKDIREYKEKWVLGLTLRQAICTVIAIGVSIPLYRYGVKIVGQEIISWVVILTAVPIFLIGYFKYNGMPFEQFALIWFKINFIYPEKRLYKTKNLYYEILEEDSKREKRELKKKNARHHKANNDRKERKQNKKQNKEGDSQDRTADNSL